MQISDIKTVETNVNPFAKYAKLPVVRKNGEIGYAKVNAGGGEKDKEFGADGKEIKK